MGKSQIAVGIVDAGAADPDLRSGQPVRHEQSSKAMRGNEDVCCRLSDPLLHAMISIMRLPETLPMRGPGVTEARDNEHAGFF